MKQRRLIIAAVVVAAIVGLAVRFWPKADDSLKVPLGVEQAAIISFSGPRLEVAPYQWGVAVNVRIAEIVEQPDHRVYDVRYIVNRAGDFDLRDYLTAADGSKLENLPAFRFIGDAQLSKDLDTRIEETEELRIEVGGHYLEWIAALGVLWIAWLLLLIFWRREKMIAADDGIKAPTPAKVLRALVQQLERGQLDAAGKAQLEMLLLRRWREDLALGGLTMSDAMRVLGQNERTAAPLKKLQHWLHHPASTVPREEITTLLAPFAAESA